MSGEIPRGKKRPPTATASFGGPVDNLSRVISVERVCQENADAEKYEKGCDYLAHGFPPALVAPAMQLPLQNCS